MNHKRIGEGVVIALIATLIAWIAYFVWDTNFRLRLLENNLEQFMKYTDERLQKLEDSSGRNEREYYYMRGLIDDKLFDRQQE